ncbi:DUF7674 family protein [Chryseobacterium sp. CT-SW4]|uniref:DUF7674 family protein n=1 Tax=Chryseobacterium sp. SW-1 TaxID=3157343 RepID=UPI003B027F9C
MVFHWIDLNKSLLMNQNQSLKKMLLSLPEIQNSADHTEKSPYEMIEAFTNHMRWLIDQNDNKQIEENLKIIGQVYEEANSSLKNAIDNIFIYSLDHSANFHGDKNREDLLGLLPANLRSVYLHQVYKSGL